MDRASIDRGWGAKVSKSPYAIGGMTPPNAWDLPVVIGLDLELALCIKHHDESKNGHQVYRFPTGGRREIPFGELWPVEISIHWATYDRYNELPRHWPRLETGDLVLCRSRTKCPMDFYRGGHDAPLSCARVSSDPAADNWKEAIKSKRW